MHKYSNRPLALVLSFLLVFSAVLPASAATVASDYESHWASGIIRSGIAAGIISGYADGSFKPENAISRSEFFVLVNNAFKFTTMAAIAYTDVADGAWYAPAIRLAKAAGYINGYPDGGIHPDGNISRQEAAVVLSRISKLTPSSTTLPYTDAAEAASWSKQAIIAASEAKIMVGYPEGDFKPEAAIKRAEALVAVMNCYSHSTPAPTPVATPVASPVATPAVSGLTENEKLGKALFFDKNLSANNNQSCATCHTPEFGFVGSDPTFNANGSVYEGSIPGAFGDRKPPSAAYGGSSPTLNYVNNLWMGGMFWDGRATGAKLGDPLAEQAQGPFLNPKEQANPDAAAICKKVSESEYKDLFERVWGPISVTSETTNMMFEHVARSISAYERSAEVNPFTSKYDFYLKGQAQLTDLETKGLQLFEGKAMCSSCHVSTPGAGGSPLFTDYTYDNLGIPKNPANPVYTSDPYFIDLGLGGYLKTSGFAAAVYEPEFGKFKVPTLRNVALKPSVSSIKAYGHNGTFKSLGAVVHFYNTRDTASAGWPSPEYSATMNRVKIGNLGLSMDEEFSLVEFLNTLSDGYVP